jgi:hypothetical protein
VAKITAHVDLQVKVRPGDDPGTLERAIAAEGRRAARELYLRVVEAMDEQALATTKGARQRREPRWVATLFGRVRILRYRVKNETESFHPLDRILDLRRSEASRAARHLIMELARRLSYRDVAQVITEITGETFTYQHVNRVLREHGE